MPCDHEEPGPPGVMLASPTVTSGSSQPRHASTWTNCLENASRAVWLLEPDDHRERDLGKRTWTALREHPERKRAGHEDDGACNLPCPKPGMTMVAQAELRSADYPANITNVVRPAGSVTRLPDMSFAQPDLSDQLTDGGVQATSYSVARTGRWCRRALMSGLSLRRTPKEHQMLMLLLANLQNFPLQRLLRSERGATAVEYGLIVALIAAAIVITAGALGGQISTIFNNITGQMQPAN
jgi:pilus assembly protein Flp/PilA